MLAPKVLVGSVGGCLVWWLPVVQGSIVSLWRRFRDSGTVWRAGKLFWFRIGRCKALCCRGEATEGGEDVLETLHSFEEMGEGAKHVAVLTRSNVWNVVARVGGTWHHTVLRLDQGSGWVCGASYLSSSRLSARMKADMSRNAAGVWHALTTAPHHLLSMPPAWQAVNELRCWPLLLGAICHLQVCNGNVGPGLILCC